MTRLVARKLFKSLWYCNIDHCYLLLNDMNFERKLYANNDEDALNQLNW